MSRAAPASRAATSLHPRASWGRAHKRVSSKADGKALFLRIATVRRIIRKRKSGTEIAIQWYMGYTRLRDLRRALLLSVLAALVLTQVHSGQPASDERIVINVAERTLSIVKDDKPVATYPIAVGKPETPTPNGAFHVLKLDPHPGSRTGIFGTRWIEFSRTKMANGAWFLYGIHGT